MYFLEIVKRLTIDVFTFLAIVVNGLLLYFQMVPFVRAAVSLKMLNAQTISFLLFTIMMLVLPVALLNKNAQTSKKRLLSRIFYIIAAVIFIGTLADLISFRGFFGYKYSEGDAVFVNMMWNMPTIFGALFSVVIASLYCVLAKKIRHVRRLSLLLIFIIFLLSSLAPFVYSYIVSSSLPRQTWLVKAAFIIPEYILLLVAFSVAASSREIWIKHIW